MTVWQKASETFFVNLTNPGLVQIEGQGVGHCGINE